MKINWNAKYFTIAAYALCTIILSAVAIMLIFNFDAVIEKLSVMTGIITPIIIGIFCAYLLNPLMVKLENGLFGKLARSSDKKKNGMARVLALTLTMLIILAFLALIIILIIPQLVTNIIAIFNNMDTYIANVREFIQDISDDYPQIAEFLGNPLNDFSKFISDLWAKYSSEFMNFAGNVAAGIWSVINTLSNVFIGLVLSVYLLAKKEMFVGQTKKLIFAFMKVERAQRFLGVCGEASEKFLGSIIGKIIESLLVAMLYFIGLICMNMPYAPLISVVMFVFNLIPFVGPVIGAIPCTLLLILSDHPIMALWFLAFVVVLQTIDGNIIGPWILGDQTGLPAVWILVSIIIGGGFFGAIGMFLGVPVCAVVYMLIKDFIEGRLKKRKLPPNTTNYIGKVDYITPDFVYEEPPTPTVQPKVKAEEKRSVSQMIKDLHTKLSNKNKK
ncbi:MAG: AI-2E family transporter [Oscillospiraceae bacterium]|nr:AI-2E family transporter [Oscillospiraceae bacterium]